MVSGLAPGRVAVIWMVGKSTARQRRDRQQPVGEDAEHDERRRHQRRHAPAGECRFPRVFIGSAAGAFALRGATRVPFDSSN